MPTPYRPRVGLPPARAAAAAVQKPIQYVGGELNSDAEGVGLRARRPTVRWALMYPDAYEVGLPNQGVQILYEVLNERDWILAERTYSVWPDMEQVMRRDEQGRSRSSPSTATARSAPSTCSACPSPPSSATPTCSPRSTSPASRCTPSTAARTTRSSSPAATPPSTPSRSPTSSTPPCSATARRSCSRSPRSMREWKAEGVPGRSRRAAAPARGLRRRLRPEVLRRRLRRRRLHRGASCPTRPGVPLRVSKHTLMDLDPWPYPANPLVPLAETVHERFSVEIFRGCTRGCRFCQAGMITRPVRERSIKTIGDMVENGIRKSGLRGGRPALALERRPHRDRRGRQGPGRPLRGHQRLALPAVHARGRLQHHPRQRVLPQRAPIRASRSPPRAARSGCARSSTRW